MDAFYLISALFKGNAMTRVYRNQQDSAVFPARCLTSCLYENGFNFVKKHSVGDTKLLGDHVASRIVGRRRCLFQSSLFVRQSRHRQPSFSSPLSHDKRHLLRLLRLNNGLCFLRQADRLHRRHSRRPKTASSQHLLLDSWHFYSGQNLQHDQSRSPRSWTGTWKIHDLPRLLPMGSVCPFLTRNPILRAALVVEEFRRRPHP